MERGSQERRDVLVAHEMRLETREDGGRRLVGYAAVFNAWADIAGLFMERVAPGAFAGSLGGDIRSLFNHDRSWVLGRTTNGSLRLREDERGLRYEVDLPDTQQARDVAELVERGDVSGMSFMFMVLRDEWDFNSEPARRTLLEVELVEAGPVTWPAYPQTSINAARGASDVLADARSAHAPAPAPEPGASMEARRKRLELEAAL